MSDDITDEEAQAAKDALQAAIRAYFEIACPGQYVDAWVLVTHRLSVDMVSDNVSAVGQLVPTGQPWPLTVGMLRIASLQAEDVS